MELNSDKASSSDPARSLLFSPITINGVRLENRAWIPAMVTWLSPDGTVTEDVRRRYVRFAQGASSGMIVLEATGVHETKSGPLLRISDDSYVPGFKSLVAEMHDCSSAKVVLQIIHFLKIATRNPDEYLKRIGRGDLAGQPDSVVEGHLTARQYEDFCFGYRQRVEDLDIAEIREIPGLFARAARRARLAGFDGVELAHGPRIHAGFVPVEALQSPDGSIRRGPSERQGRWT